MEAILGIAVSVLIQWLKKWLGSGRFMTITITLVLSILSAAVWYGVSLAGWGDHFLKIMAYAGAFYVFIIKSVQNL